jgi:hypothetical protein
MRPWVNHVTARVQFNVLDQSGGLPGLIPEGT